MNRWLLLFTHFLLLSLVFSSQKYERATEVATATVKPIIMQQKEQSERHGIKIRFIYMPIDTNGIIPCATHFVSVHFSVGQRVTNLCTDIGLAKMTTKKISRTFLSTNTIKNITTLTSTMMLCIKKIV